MASQQSSTSNSYTYDVLCAKPPAAVINKIKWKMMLAIEREIIGNGGNIFGGFVRDKIIHNDAADNFYDHMIKQGITGDSVEFQLKYNDVTVLPEYKERCIMPSDIDCYMDSEQIKNVIDSLKKKNYNVKVKKTGQANFYFFVRSTNIDISKLIHTKLIIKMDCNQYISDIFNLNDFEVNVDLIHAKRSDKVNIYDILSSNIEFECNSLFINSNNEIRLSNRIASYLNPIEKLKKINDVITDIKLKKTKVYQDSNNVIPVFRWEKMISKGWKVSSLYFEFMKDTEYDGHCIICHDNISKEHFHIKDCNCDARFHLGCYLKMNKHTEFKQECPMCKSQSFINTIEASVIEIFAKRQGELQIDEQNFIPEPIILPIIPLPLPPSHQHDLIQLRDQPILIDTQNTQNIQYLNQLRDTQNTQNIQYHPLITRLQRLSENALNFNENRVVIDILNDDMQDFVSDSGESL
jgi:hypothetical protein